MQGRDNWYNGYREYDPETSTIDYDPNVDFIPFVGGEDAGAWDGWSQTWTGSAWVRTPRGPVLGPTKPL